MLDVQRQVGLAKRYAVAGLVWLVAIVAAAGLASPAAAQAPVLNMFFNAASIPVGGTTQLIFNFNNPSGTALTNVRFTDTLPSGVVVASTPNIFNNCGGTVTATAGSGVITLAGLAMAPGFFCTIRVDVLGATVGLKTNTVTPDSDQGTGAPDSDPMTVTQGSSTTTDISSVNPSTFGQSVTFTATVAGGGVTPTGTVTFKDGAATLGTGTLSGGVATFSTSTLTVANHNITAVYGGDSNYTGSTSAVLVQTVNQASTATALTSSANPSALGQSVTFTANVTGAGGTPTGTITFNDGATTLGTGTLSGGTATFSTSILASGGHAITAVYGGDTTSGASTSSVLTQTVLANGAVVLRVVTTDGDGTFAFASATPGLSLALATSGGNAQSASISLNPGTYTVTVTPPSGFGLTSVACSDGDSTGDVSTRSATIRLASAEAVVCTFSAANSRAKTVQAIYGFLSRRNDLIMSNQPDDGRQIDRLIEAQTGGSRAQVSGFAARGAGTADEIAMRLGSGIDAGGLSRFRFAPHPGLPLGTNADADADAPAIGPAGTVVAPFRFMGDTDGPAQMSFSTSLRQIARYADEAEALKAREGGLGLAATGARGRTPHVNPFDFWIESRYASFSDDRNRAGYDGHFGLLYVGADYVINPSFLIGALVQLDDMRQTSRQLASDVRGVGWMAGPYATLRLTQSIFLQARAAWGRSSNEISPYLSYTDEFESDRWLVSSTLTGRWQHGPWQFRPSASISYMEDVAKSYTDSLGVLIPDVRSRLGQVKAGPAISYAYRMPDGSTLMPRLGLDVIWNFAADNAPSSVSGVSEGPEGARGRVELGVRATTAGGLSVDVSASYDGIGSENFEAVLGKAVVRVPLN